VARHGSGHRAALIAQFLGRYGHRDGDYELFGDDVLRRAMRSGFGHEQFAHLRSTERAFRARLRRGLPWHLELAGSHGHGYGLMRQDRPGIRGAFVQVESRMTQTGANADEWVPARPGTEASLHSGSRT